MELLLNLIWVAVIIAFWGGWLHRRRCGCKASLLPGFGIQIIALAMLSAILLPAISITDDLQALHYPAEVQRTFDRNDRHSFIVKSPQSIPAALVLLAFCLQPQRVHTIACVTANDPRPHGLIAFGNGLWSRPPPSA